MSAAYRAATALAAIDLRALAALRVGLGLLVLGDVGLRALSLRALYTDAGVLPRAEVLQQFAWLHEWGLSLHLLGGSTVAQALLFALHAAAGLALVAGFRTTAAVCLAWLLTTSVQLRNLYIGGGFDALLRMLLLWGMFLPLGARASLDARRRGGPPPAAPHLSVGSVALLLQVAVVYLAAGLAKGETTLWRDGDALALVLHDEFFTTAFGAWLGGQESLCRLLTWAVLGAELAAPLLLFALAPLPRLRFALVAGLAAMNAGFGLALSVGGFPWAMTVALLPFVPAFAWDRAETATAALRQRWTAATAGLAARLVPYAAAAPAAGRRGAWVAQGFCALVLAWVLAWNVAVARNPDHLAPEAIRWFGNTLFLQQSWRMFASPSTISGWIVVRGTLVDGSEVDLLAAGGPLPGDEAIRPVSWERPDDLLGSTAGIRWRTLLRRTTAGSDPQQSPLHYGRYLCREWNRTHADDRRLARFEIVRVIKDLAPPWTAAEYRREVTWEHDCFG